MKKNTNIIKVKVPIGYDPMVKVFFFKQKRIWACDYFLPSEERVKFRRYLPKKEFNTERKARSFSLKKRDALLNGVLNSKEYEKLQKNYYVESLPFKIAVKKYLELTALNKSNNSLESEKAFYKGQFKFFKKELGLDCLEKIRESHVRSYRSHLINLASVRKEAERKFLSKLEVSSSVSDKKHYSNLIRSSGISPATAESYFDKMKKLFNKLHQEMLLASNPCKNVAKIKIAVGDKVRKQTFEPKHIMRISECGFVHKQGFPLVLFTLFLAETGARKAEATHLEWPDVDFETRIWKIRAKPSCPTRFGLGWSPKWGKERDVYLSENAIAILDLIPREPSFGIVRTEGKQKDFVPGKFIFTRWSKKENCRLRVDEFKRSWESMLECAGVPHLGLEKFILHDFRRYRNVIDECVHKLTVRQRGEKLGNSERVNRTHYAGHKSSELVTSEGRIRELMSRNLELEAKIKLLESKLETEE